MTAPQGEVHKHPRYGMIWFYLLILTVVEVGVGYGYLSYPQWKTLGVIVLIVLAAWKAALVGAYFMHLKFEKWAMITIVLAPLLLLMILAIALMPDVLG